VDVVERVTALQLQYAIPIVKFILANSTPTSGKKKKKT
jgi:hypothetical protein